METFKDILKGGLKVLIPFLIIALVIYWVLKWTEKLFGTIFVMLFGEQAHFFGCGLLLAFAAIIAVGLIMRLPIMQWALRQLENGLKRLPLINSLYRMSTDVFQFLAKKKSDRGDDVVLVTTPLGKIIGIKTTDDPDHIGKDPDSVAVYFPMSYQIGGFTLYVPKNQVEALDMGIEDAMEFIMTAWITNKKEKDS